MKRLSIFLIVLLSVIGCDKEIDVPFLVDEDEIARYVSDSDLGRIFFSTSNLVIEEPFTYPQDSNAVYLNIVDSSKRSFVTFIPYLDIATGYSNATQEFGSPFGSSRDAEVTVRDNIFLTVLRIEGNDTTTFATQFQLERYGYFMKLGDDGDRFSGWVLRGFNGGMPQNGTIVDLFHGNDDLFTGNTSRYEQYVSNFVNNSVTPLDTFRTYTTTQSYLLLNGDKLLIERVTAGEQIKAQVRNANDNLFFTVGQKTNSSFVQETMVPNSELKLESTFNLPSNVNNSWGFIYFQEYYRNPNDSTNVPPITSLFQKKWLVPYRIE